MKTVMCPSCRWCGGAIGLARDQILLCELCPRCGHHTNVVAAGADMAQPNTDRSVGAFSDGEHTFELNETTVRLVLGVLNMAAPARAELLRFAQLAYPAWANAERYPHAFAETVVPHAEPLPVDYSAPTDVRGPTSYLEQFATGVDPTTCAHTEAVYVPEFANFFCVACRHSMGKEYYETHIAEVQECVANTVDEPPPHAPFTEPVLASLPVDEPTVVTDDNEAALAPAVTEAMLVCANGTDAEPEPTDAKAPRKQRGKRKE